MKGQAVYDCKAKCEALASCCHNTKNRCIEKMCEVDKSECKKMAQFLKCLMVCECLCSYICTCCCEMEEVSGSCLTELCGKCDKLLGCCKDLKGCLPNDMCEYLNCDKLMGCCCACKSSGKSKSKSKGSKKSKKK
jgi:hypothetical protein